MRKLILAGTAAIGLGAPFAAAHATATQTSAPARPMEITVIAAAPAPDLQRLQNQMQYLQTEMQALQMQQQNSSAYNLAEVENLPSGG